MPLSGARTYVGFGFGPIQAGLFLYEAFHSGNFKRLVVAEVDSDVMNDLRRAGGYYSLNIAHPDRIETCRVGPVEVYDPGLASDRQVLIDAIASAHEMATAIPSVDFYETQGPGSIHRVLADGLSLKLRQRGPHAVISSTSTER